jgi:hypothetical protein
MHSIVKSYLQSEFFVRQGPRPVIIQQSQQGRVHMKKTRAVGIFKVAPNSGPITFHLSLPGQKIPPATIKLHQDEILFVLGSVTVIDFVSDTSLNMELVWVGYSSLPVGMDIENKDVLDFATL